VYFVKKGLSPKKVYFGFSTIFILSVTASFYLNLENEGFKMAKAKFPKTQKGLIKKKPPESFKKIRIVPEPQLPSTIDEFYIRMIIEIHNIYKELNQCKGILSEIRNQKKVDK